MIAGFVRALPEPVRAVLRPVRAVVRQLDAMGRRRQAKTLARDIETERLTLRTIGAVETIMLTLPWRKDPDLMQGLYLSATPKSVVEWLRTGFKPDNIHRFAFAIVPRGAARPIGMIVVVTSPDGGAYGHVAIADRAWWGRQVPVEARAALIEHFFRHGGVKWFDASIDARNAGSVFIYRRLGFRYCGVVAGYCTDPATGRVIDKVNFILTRDMWETRRDRASAPQPEARETLP